MDTKGQDKQVGEDMKRTRQIESCAIRDKEGKYAPDLAKHRMWFRLSSAALCDDGLLIESDAWTPHMARFMTNPVVGDSHSYAPVVERLLGKIVDYEIDKQGPLGLVEFAVGTQNGAWADYLAFNGFLNAGSVGFEIVMSGQDETEDGRKFTRVTEAKLLEFSLVMLPMDESALVEREDSAVLVRALKSITGSETEDTEPGPNPDRDRIAEIQEELRGIRIMLKALLDAQPPADAVGRVHLPNIEVNGSLVSEALKGLSDPYKDRSYEDSQADLERIRKEVSQ